MTGVHHPWRAFKALADWTLHWAHLPEGIWGETCWETKTVTLAHGLNQAERRCTIAHETQHVLRGPVPIYMEAKEEVRVDRNAARLLIPDVRVLGDVLAWSTTLDEAAVELWVDVEMLEVRLSSLHPAERAYLKQRLDAESHPA